MIQIRFVVLIRIRVELRDLVLALGLGSGLCFGFRVGPIIFKF